MNEIDRRPVSLGPRPMSLLAFAVYVGSCLVVDVSSARDRRLAIGGGVVASALAAFAFTRAWNAARIRRSPQATTDLLVAALLVTLSSLLLVTVAGFELSMGARHG